MAPRLRRPDPPSILPAAASVRPGAATGNQQQQHDVGINVPAVRQRIGIPAFSPVAASTSVDGNKVIFTMRDPNDAKRRKRH